MYMNCTSTLYVLTTYLPHHPRSETLTLKFWQGGRWAKMGEQEMKWVERRIQHQYLLCMGYLIPI